MLRVATAIMVILVTVEAHAYNLRETDGGKVIRWQQSEIEIVLDDSLAVLGSMDEVEQSLVTAFDSWVDNAGLPIEFKFVRGDCNEPGYDHINCILAWDDEWNKPGGDVGASTIMTYRPQSGKIVDADIVFNARDWEWSLDGESGALSIPAVAAHEIGHLLGMAHSEVEEATMFPRTKTGETIKTSLHLDDIEGADDLYEDTWMSDTDLEYGCSVASVGGDKGSNAWLAFMALGLAVVVRRRLR